MPTEMTLLKFYNDMGSQPCRAIWMFLKVTKIPFQDVPIAMYKGEHKTEEYLKKFPTGKVPGIDDDGFTMIESVAILQYLCAKYANLVAPNWYPNDIQQRARVDEVTSWWHTNIRKNGSAYFVAKFMGPIIRKIPADEEKIKEIAAEFDKSLDFMENHLLKKTNFLAGDDVTFADLICICEVMQPVSAGYDVTKGRPKLAAWMERLKSRLGPIVDNTHNKLLNLIKPH